MVQQWCRALLSECFRPKTKSVAEYLRLLLKLLFLMTLGYWAVCVGPQLILVLYVYLRGFSESELIHPKDLYVNRTMQAILPDQFNMTAPREVLQVPKILHRTWKNDNISTVPIAKWQECYNWCISHHTHWKHILWTDKMARDFVVMHYSWFLPYYDSYPYPIMRVDAMRYFILYHYGGVYMDMDISCGNSLDGITDFAPLGVALLSQTRPVGVSNDILMSPARHPFFALLIRKLRESKGWYGSNYPTVFFSTGPSFVTHNYVFGPAEDTGKVMIMANDLTSKGDGNHTYFAYVGGSTWHGSDANLVKWMVGVMQELWKKYWEPNPEPGQQTTPVPASTGYPAGAAGEKEGNVLLVASALAVMGMLVGVCLMCSRGGSLKSKNAKKWEDKDTV